MKQDKLYKKLISEKRWFNKDLIHPEWYNLELKYEYIIPFERFNNLSVNEKYKYLIKNNIYIKYKKIEWGKNSHIHCVDDYVPYEYPVIDSFNLDDYITFENIEYEINPEIKDEFYEYLEVRILEGYSDYITNIQHVEFQIALLSKKEKIKFLKRKLKKAIKKFTKYQINALFINKTVNWYTDWRSFMIDNVITDTFLLEYLTKGGNNSFKNKIVKQWIQAHELIESIFFYKKQISIINNPNILKQKEEKKLFKDFFTKEYTKKYINYLDYLEKEFSRFKYVEKSILIYILKKNKTIEENNWNLSGFLRAISNGSSSGFEYMRRQFVPNENHTKLKDNISSSEIEEVKKKLDNIYFNINIKKKASKS